MSIVWKIILIVALLMAVFGTVWCARDAYLRSKCPTGQAPVKGTSF